MVRLLIALCCLAALALAAAMLLSRFQVTVTVTPVASRAPGV